MKPDEVTIGAISSLELNSELDVDKSSSKSQSSFNYRPPLSLIYLCKHQVNEINPTVINLICYYYQNHLLKILVI